MFEEALNELLKTEMYSQTSISLKYITLNDGRKAVLKLSIVADDDSDFYDATIWKPKTLTDTWKEEY